MPAAVQMQIPSTTPKSASISEYLSKLTERIKLSHKIALEVSNRRHARNKRLFDQKLTMYRFQEGDPVYLFRSVAQRGQYYKFIRPWKPAVIIKKLSDLNYRVRVFGGKKSIVVHHNRLKPRSDDPSVPVSAPDLTIPSSEVSTSEVEAPRAPPTPRYALLGGDSYMSPCQHTVGNDSAVSDAPVSPPLLTEDPDDSVQPPRIDTGDDSGDVAAPEGDSFVPSNVPLPAVPVPLPAAPVPLPAVPVPLPAAPVPLSAAPVPLSAAPVPLPAAPVPLPRRSLRESRPPDRFVPG